MKELAVKPKGPVEIEVNQGPLEPGESLTIWYAPDGVFHLQDVSLYDHENGRVDVKVRMFGAEIKWSSLYHVDAVRIDRTFQPNDSLKATLRNVSDETVFARIRLRGFWK